MTNWISALVLLSIACFTARAQEYSLEGKEVEEEQMQAAPPPDDGFECTPEVGFIRRGGTFNDPSQTITETPVECCRLCFEEPRCETWSRQRSTGECALMDTVPPLERDEDFDSGFLGTVDALEVIRQPDCLVERNVFFPDGDVLEETRTRNAKRCCEKCLDNFSCFSWYYERDSSTCVMNRNIPEVAKRRGFRGAALF